MADEKRIRTDTEKEATAEGPFNKTTLAAMEEARRIAHDENAETFHTIEEWRKSLGI